MKGNLSSIINISKNVLEHFYTNEQNKIIVTYYSREQHEARRVVGVRSTVVVVEVEHACVSRIAIVAATDEPSERTRETEKRYYR